MITGKIPFSWVQVNENFSYDGDSFVKTSEHIAWEIRGNARYKEWCFQPDDRVILQHPTKV